MNVVKTALFLLIALSMPNYALGEDTASPAYEMPGLDRPLNLTTPEEAVRSMFRAMYLGDASLVDRVFLEDAQLRRVTASGDVRPDGLKRWRDWVGEQSEGDAVEEIFNVKVEEFGHLATVWAPFVVTYKGEKVGCGVNQFTLAKTEDDWRIVFGMDTAAEATIECESFKQFMKAN